VRAVFIYGAGAQIKWAQALWSVIKNVVGNYRRVPLITLWLATMIVCEICDAPLAI